MLAHHHKYDPTKQVHYFHKLLKEPPTHPDDGKLAFDLSWKPSQIEGNTYILLETEQLLKEKLIAKGKPKYDSIMPVNHKDKIDFIVEKSDYMNPLTLAKIEYLHGILIKELVVSKNIRTKRVDISGTNHDAIDNESQIKKP